MEIKCPECGHAIDISQTEYAALLQQVRTEAFDKEVHAQVEVVKAAMEAEKARAVSEAVTAGKMDVAATERRLEEEIGKLRQAKLQSDAEHDSMMRAKDEEIAFYKDFKARQSTKMVGESLERFCEDEFNKVRAAGFQRAYFEKDNEVSKSGSKGDFIFRDYDDTGFEFVSIMFEMKNEVDRTATKHKNADFFKELDKDRREKGCEYAVLVTMLEPDSELYNTGIVDVNHKYEKMYVIRPQFFIPLITILRNAAMRSLEYQHELERARLQDVDVETFESALDEFRDKFGRNVDLTDRKFQDAISEIDKAIDILQRARASLEGADRNLKLAAGKAEALTVRSLTRNNATMQELFGRRGR